MTEKTILISVRLPAKLADKLPAPGSGRSRFIAEAIAEKADRRRQIEEWKPGTRRGRRIAKLLAKGRAERLPLLSEPEVQSELARRRGREF